jgi:hypothetical protein
MMRLVLNAHPHIAIPPETSYFPEVYWPYAVRDSNPTRDTESWAEVVDSFMRLCEARFHPAIDLDRVGRELRAGPPDFALLLSLPLTAWARAQGKGRWGEKTPLHIFYADVIMRLWPTARIIAMQRDPRAVVASLNRFVAAGHDTVMNARLWHDVWTRGRDILCASAPPAQRLIVRYEDLVRDPEPVIHEVCAFLGEDFTPAMLSFGETASDYVDRVRSAKIQQPIRADPDDWRGKLSDSQLAIVERVCASPMAALGYEHKGGAPGPTELAHLTIKLAYVRYKQWQHRHDRYRSVTYSPFGRVRAYTRRHRTSHSPTG